MLIMCDEVSKIVENKKIMDYYFNLKEIIYIERDENGVVINTNDFSILEIYDEIINSSIHEDNHYYHIGSKTWYEVIKNEIYDDCDSTIHTIEYLQNITSLKEQISSLMLDSLTGVMRNRNECNKRINNYIEYALKNDEEFSVLIGDIDYFKVINDQYGHSCGDFILSIISNILIENTNQRCDKFDCHNNDIILRIGGDEFLVLLKNISNSDTVSKINEITSKIKYQKISYDGKDISVSMSFGYVHFNKKNFLNINVDNIREELIKKADCNLYKMKKERNN